MPDTRNAVLTEGPVGKTIVRLTLPMILGLIGMVTFNLVDTFFVGHLGTEELAALGFTFPAVLIINSLALGLGTGAGAVISRAIGEGDHHRVRRLTTDSLVLSLLVVMIFVVAGLLTIRPVFRLIGASGEVLDLVAEYMSIWYLGVGFVVIPMVGNNAIRATGDTKTPSIVMLVAVAANGSLDPLLIFGVGPFPRLEIAGAALATVLARATTFVVALWVLGARDKMLSARRPSFAEVSDSWKRILYIGVPTAATRVILPVAVGIVTRFVASYGVGAVAAFGVATRIEFFAMTIVRALSAVLMPFIGQNWGAGKMERVYAGMRFSEKVSLGWGILALGILAGAARPIASIFNDDPEVIRITVLYLRIVPLGYGLYGVGLLAAAGLNVLNRPIHAASLAAFHMLVLHAPLAYIGSSLYGLRGLFGGLAVSFLVSGLVAHWLFRSVASEVEPSSPSGR
jgi:putative MATE family efflux protein